MPPTEMLWSAWPDQRSRSSAWQAPCRIRRSSWPAGAGAASRAAGNAAATGRTRRTTVPARTGLRTARATQPVPALPPAPAAPGVPPAAPVVPAVPVVPGVLVVPAAPRCRRCPSCRRSRRSRSSRPCRSSPRAATPTVPPRPPAPPFLRSRRTVPGAEDPPFPAPSPRAPCPGIPAAAAPQREREARCRQSLEKWPKAEILLLRHGGSSLSRAGKRPTEFQSDAGRPRATGGLRRYCRQTRTFMTELHLHGHRRLGEGPISCAALTAFAQPIDVRSVASQPGPASPLGADKKDSPASSVTIRIFFSRIPQLLSRPGRPVDQHHFIVVPTTFRNRKASVVTIPVNNARMS